MLGRPSVVVVVVTYNSADVLPDCLNALSTGLEGLSVTSVLVVDNASSDDTVERARDTAPCARIIHSGANVGYAAAINKAVALADDHDFLLVLNPDAVLQAGAGALLADALSVPGRGIAVPRIVGETGSLAHSLRREPKLRTAIAEAVLGGPRAARFGLGERVADPRVYAESGPVDWATGAALLISRRCENLVGAWDESYLLYSEETDFMLRARDAGLTTWYVPGAVAAHRGGESGTSPFLWSLLMINRARFYATRHNRMMSLLYRLVLLTGEGVRALVGRPRSKAASAVLLRPSRRVRQLPQ